MDTGAVPPDAVTECLPFSSRTAREFRRISGDIAPSHLCADSLHSALACARSSRKAMGLAGLRARSPEQQWMSHDRSRTLFDQRSAGTARRHLAELDLRAPAFGKPPERGLGLSAVHCRDGDRGVKWSLRSGPLGRGPIAVLHSARVLVG